MHRKLAISALCLAVFAASAGDCFARGRVFGSGRSVSSVFKGGAGPLARLNKPLIPTMPGLPTVSPLGLIAPRMSNAVSIFQFGGFTSQAGRLAALGVVSPRISPVAGMIARPPVTPAARRMYVLTMISPRAAVLVGMFKAAQGAGGMFR
jgi:hypothetical protein